jgi:hypothetical protein
MLLCPLGSLIQLKQPASYPLQQQNVNRLTVSLRGCGSDVIYLHKKSSIPHKKYCKHKLIAETPRPTSKETPGEACETLVQMQHHGASTANCLKRKLLLQPRH